VSIAKLTFASTLVSTFSFPALGERDPNEELNHGDAADGNRTNSGKRSELCEAT
jgi:hypothetical protein